MDITTSSLRIKHQKATNAEWISKNPILLDGEVAIVDYGDSVNFKVGNGVSTFLELPFTDQYLRSELNQKKLKRDIQKIDFTLDLSGGGTSFRSPRVPDSFFNYTSSFPSLDLWTLIFTPVGNDEEDGQSLIDAGYIYLEKAEYDYDAMGIYFYFKALFPISVSSLNCRITAIYTG